jgi:poly-gamma-glutamate synthesis protein (capsule biosynthesis protein)
MLGPTFVGYGLGNFDFRALSAVTMQTGVVVVTVTGRHIDNYEFVPGIVNGAVATPLEGADAQAAVDAWNSLRPCTGLT